MSLRVSWVGFLNRKKNTDPTVRVLLDRGGRTANDMEERLQRDVFAGRIDNEAFALRMTRLKGLRAEYNRTRPCVKGIHNPGEWVDLGDGSWMRRVIGRTER